MIENAIVIFYVVPTYYYYKQELKNEYCKKLQALGQLVSEMYKHKLIIIYICVHTAHCRYN